MTCHYALKNMNELQKYELHKLVGKGVRFDCRMAQYTTFQIGGYAEALIEVTTLKALQAILGFLKESDIPYLVVGRGSNLLVKDSGFKGTVLILTGEFEKIETESGKDKTVFAGAGVSIMELLRHCRSAGLGGLEFLAGIPGTVGGALAMNAGAYGEEIGGCVKTLQMLDPTGALVEKEQAELVFSYRNFHMEKGAVITCAVFKVHSENRQIISERMGRWLKKRKQSQPLEYPSAGSVFKNPTHEHAGRLIEAAGLKGRRIGGAKVSEKHGNFIVNTGGASAEDVLNLLNLVREAVRKLKGIDLEPEIQVVGD
jgi:UDP-N-acetylmuramate dehydrogenase